MPVRRLAAADYFGIRVIDEATGRGVPLVELETVHHVSFVTDSAGWVAVGDPGMLGPQEVYFHIRSHGYEFPKDGFGYAGVRLALTPGGRATVKVRRVNIAERLCRLTGEGIYADSTILGQPVPTREPLLSGRVYGQDSTQTALYKGKMLWFWGDTSRPSYPLGNFHTTGAVATLPQGRKDADFGLDYRYFTGQDGFVREMCPNPKPGPIWISGLAVLGTGNDQTLLAHYSRIKDLGAIYEQGYIEWDDARSVFQVVKEIPTSEKWRFLDGHLVRTTEGSTPYLGGGFCFPIVRVPERRDSILDPAAYEAYTCRDARGEVRRDTRGRAVYTWQKDAPPIISEDEANLIKQGKLNPEDAHFHPLTPDGRRIIVHGGSVAWNPYRKRWIFIGTAKGEKESLLGEIYYGEADSPVGPWRRAVKILTHNQYTFYNPVHHPFLDGDGGRIIYFEGTYTETFSGNPRPTPRYDYNQMLYRLDLSDPRLLPARG